MAELENRNKHEETFARKLGRLSSRHRKELIRLLGNPPDINKVPAEFWQRVEEETEKELAALLLLIFLLSATQHGMAQPTAQQASQLWSVGRARTVAQGYVTHSRKMLRTAADDWDAVIDVGDDVPKAVVEKRVTTIFGPSRDAAIATNETTNAGTSGSDAGIDATVGIDEKDVWWTKDDQRVCPICGPLHKTIRGNWGRFFPDGPPAHVGCRCWFVYANEKQLATVGSA